MLKMSERVEGSLVDIIEDLQEQLAEARASYRELEPCGHPKNFLMGDEYGHFTCVVCQRDLATAKLATARVCDCCYDTPDPDEYGLVSAFSSDCVKCHGNGVVFSDEREKSCS